MFGTQLRIRCSRPSTGCRSSARNRFTAMVRSDALREGTIMSGIILDSTDAVTTARIAPASRLRLTRRGRAVFTTLAATPLVVAALAFALNGGMATATAEPGSTSYVTVLAGQSLWQLAEQVAPGEDTRETVAQLLRANALESAEVFPGQQLAVPSQYR